MYNYTISVVIKDKKQAIDILRYNDFCGFCGFAKCRFCCYRTAGC